MYFWLDHIEDWVWIKMRTGLWVLYAELDNGEMKATGAHGWFSGDGPD